MRLAYTELNGHTGRCALPYTREDRPLSRRFGWKCYLTPLNMISQFGANGESRTRNLLITNQSLCRLSYISKVGKPGGLAHSSERKTTLRACLSRTHSLYHINGDNSIYVLEYIISEFICYHPLNVSQGDEMVIHRFHIPGEPV